MFSKDDLLAELKKQMDEDASLPLREGATQLVFGEGNPDAKLYFLGEGPGFHEDKLGRPFVGMAGKLLDATLAEIGIKRQDVYISNLVRFRPPSNRDPEPAEIEAFSGYVDREIKIIKPEIIVTLGRFSMAKFLGDVKISSVHGISKAVDFYDQKIIVIPMYHPAAALRSREMMQSFKVDFQKLAEYLAQLDRNKIGNLNKPEINKEPKQLGLL